MATRATPEWRRNVSEAKREAPRGIIRNIAKGLDEIERHMDLTNEVNPEDIRQLRAYAQGAVGGPVRLMSFSGEEDPDAAG